MQVNEQGQYLKPFFFFPERSLFRPHGRSVMGNALQAVQQGSSAQGQSLPAICLQALLSTRHCVVASARTPIVCLFISVSLMELPTGCFWET